MKKVCLLCSMLVVFLMNSHAQSVQERLKLAVAALENDPQLKHGLVGLCVIDAKTGSPVFERNAQIGLAPASTQKIITSVTAFELLGEDYRYKTILGYDGKIQNGVLHGDFYIIGNGDPTLGSWRFARTKEEQVLQYIAGTLQKKGISEINGHIYIDQSGFSFQSIPDGWIWQDIGNYYGAGSWGFNWRENQYDLVLRPGAEIGDATEIVGTKPEQGYFTLTNTITTAKKGSGDNGYIYLAPYSIFGYTTGTIPSGENFTISGSMPNPRIQFTNQLEHSLIGRIKADSAFAYETNKTFHNVRSLKEVSVMDSILSPAFDSINYWFLKKSINLYGEALIKTLAKHHSGFGSTEKGVEVIQDYWSKRGIEKSAINIIDGSGLSPQNRVTPHALVKILAFARTRPWFNSFYDALPSFNNMKVKSGSISGARSFAGYHTSGSGKQYVLAIIVNNYDGSSGEIVKKIYRVLDALK